MLNKTNVLFAKPSVLAFVSGIRRAAGDRRKAIVATAGMMAALMFAGSASAALIKTALSIVIDGSGSISGSEFNTQRTAYQTLLGEASLLPADGSVIINVVQFSTRAQLEQTAIRISTEADRAILLDALSATNFTRLGGSTNIGGGIVEGYTDMDALLTTIDVAQFAPDFEKIIDVSTDGQHNTGTNPTTATTTAISNGYTAVNCLGIGAAANCDWNLGGADFAASSFDDLQRVLEFKLRQELDTEGIPLPGSLALLGLGLSAFGLVRRRKA